MAAGTPGSPHAPVPEQAEGLLGDEVVEERDSLVVLVVLPERVVLDFWWHNPALKGTVTPKSFNLEYDEKWCI